MFGVSADQLLADVLDVGYNIKSSDMTESIEKLSPVERERIYCVVNAMIDYNKNK